MRRNMFQVIGDLLLKVGNTLSVVSCWWYIYEPKRMPKSLKKI